MCFCMLRTKKTSKNTDAKLDIFAAVHWLNKGLKQK